MFQRPFFVVEARSIQHIQGCVGSQTHPCKLESMDCITGDLCSPPTKDRQGAGECQLHVGGEHGFPKEGGKLFPFTIPTAVQVQIQSCMCHAVATFSLTVWWLGFIPLQGPMSKYQGIREADPSLFSSGLLPIEKLIPP